MQNNTNISDLPQPDSHTYSSIVSLSARSDYEVEESGTEGKNKENEIIIPDDIPLTNILLPNEWVLYLYDKQVFKKIAKRPNFQAKPHQEIFTMKTVNDLIYILKLMEVSLDPKNKLYVPGMNKINLDANDYIIMRKGIEPIWEDPKNSNGGTFTVRVPHAKGYDLWSTFVMYMTGETLTYNMEHINGITVSYIPDNNTSTNLRNPPSQSTIAYTYIKLWDGKQNRTCEQFEKILPLNLTKKMEQGTKQYTVNNAKRHFNEKKIISKLSGNSYYGGRKGGYSRY
jgi:hypothetical protein